MDRFDRRKQRIILDLEDLAEDCKTGNDQEIVWGCIKTLRYSTIEGKAGCRCKE